MRWMYPTEAEMVCSLLEQWERAHDSGLDAEGRAWYPKERAWARRTAKEHLRGAGCAAGIAAALSPQVAWQIAKRMTGSVMLTGEPGEGCLSLSATRAWRIWLGERPLDVLRGQKTRAFYRALMGDETQAVIDSWMLQAVAWPNHYSPTFRQYERIADALRQAAEYVGEQATTFQAVVWTQVRGGGE